MFRGKSIDGGEWVYGSLFITDDNKNNPLSSRLPRKRYQIVTYFAGDWNMGGWDAVDIDPDSIGQFTGLHDVNGKEIWEGDVVSCGTRTYKIEFNDGRFVVVNNNGLVLRGLDAFQIKEMEYIVFKNIHDNP